MWIAFTAVICIIGSFLFFSIGMGVGFSFGKKEQEEIDKSVVDHYFQQDRGDA